MQLPDTFTDDDLRAWDWRAALKADERTIPWLARQTGRAQNTVYLYAWGKVTPQIEWLREVARLLWKDPAA
jgi:hypothetical protein